MSEKQSIHYGKRKIVAGGILLLLLCLLTVVSMTTAATSALSDDEIKLVAEYGGPSEALSIVGDLAYIGRGGYLIVADVTDPANPVEIGRAANLSESIEDMKLVDNTAYIANLYDGLAIVDVTDPTNPVHLSKFMPDIEAIGYTDMATLVNAEGNTAYLVMGGNIIAIDVTDPSNPVTIGHYTYFDGGVWSMKDLEVVDSIVYLATSSSLFVIDMSDPANPTLQGTYALDDDQITDVDIVGQILYVGSEDGTLHVMDATDPTQLTRLGDYRHETRPIVRVEVVNGIAYIIENGVDWGTIDDNDSLIMLDVNDPSAPALLDTFVLHGDLPIEIEIADNKAYVIDGWRGMQIVDVSDPTEPAEMGRFKDDHVHAYGHLHAVEGNIAYFTTVDGVHIVDVSDPTDLSTINMVYLTGLGSHYDVYLSNGIMYVGRKDATLGAQIVIIDVSDPTTAAVLGSVTLGAESDVRQILIENSRMYVRDDDGIHVIDVTDSSNPTYITFFEQSLRGMDVVGETMYVTMYQEMHIINMSDPTAPIVIGTYQGELYSAIGTDVQVVGDIVYVGRTLTTWAGSQWPLFIDILDVSNPQFPIKMDSIPIDYPHPNAVDSIQIDGNIIYVSVTPDNLQVIDVNDPDNPNVITDLGFSVHSRQVHLSDGYMYVNSGGAFYIYEIGSNIGGVAPPPEITPPLMSTPTITEPIVIDVRSGLEDVLLRWQVVEPLEGILDHYNVYRYQLGTIITPILLSSQVGSHYVDVGGDMGFTAGENYCYYVEAIDEAEEMIAASNITCTTFGELQLSVPHVVLPPDGTSIPVPVTVLNGNNLCLVSMDITLVYDARLVTAVDVQPTAYTAGYQFESSIEQPGRVSIASITDQCQPLAGSGALFDVMFDVRGDVGTISALNITEGLTATAIYNDGEDTPTVLQMVNGSLTVGTDATRGDVSGDEVINAFDALTALEIAAGSIDPSLQQTISCDVNGDGSCNAADSSLILCFAAHETWGICDPTATTRSGGRQAITTLTKGELSAGKLPIMLQNGANVSGGMVTFNYDPALIQVNGIDRANTLLADWTVTTDEERGLLRVAFADDEPMGTDGTLFTINVTPLVEGATVQWAGAQFNDELGLDWESNLGHTIIYTDSTGSVPLAVMVQEQTAWSAASFVGMLLLLLCGLTAAVWRID